MRQFTVFYHQGLHTLSYRFRRARPELQLLLNSKCSDNLLDFSEEWARRIDIQANVYNGFQLQKLLQWVQSRIGQRFIIYCSPITKAMYVNMKDNMIGSSTDYEYKQQNPMYMGEPFHAHLSQGPEEDRKCRDVFFLILYLLFWAGLIAVAVVAFSRGQPHLLAAPFDSSGKQCGYSQGYQGYPFGYFNSKNTSQFACINQCPQSGLTNSSFKCILNNTEFPCVNYGNYSTIEFVGVCYPTNSVIAETIDFGLSFYDESIADLKTTWPISLSIIFMTLILSLLLLFFIRACGGCLVISVIVLYFAAIVAFGVVCLLGSEGKINITVISGQDPSIMRSIAITAFVIAGISFVILVCCIRKIRIGIMVIKTTAEFTQQECQTILVPVFMFIAIALFFSFWITVSIFIFSCGQVGQCSGSPYACIDWDVGVKRSLGFYFFGLFWNCEVAIGMCQFVIASTTAYWYFGHLSGNKVSSPVCKSFCRAMFYHLGSIAFGALILCILVILQLIFQVLHRIGKEQSLSNDPVSNACTKCCVSCVRCFLACFERFIRFISHNAFIMMAITGSGFCSAAHQAFYLILRSSAAYAISHGVGHLLMFFGKLLITSICTFIGYIMITKIEYFSTELFEPVMPTIIFFVISFVISSLFMDVFGIGSDTLLLCYCLERDIHKGRARSCPEKLQAILE